MTNLENRPPPCISYEVALAIREMEKQREYDVALRRHKHLHQFNPLEKRCNLCGMTQIEYERNPQSATVCAMALPEDVT